MIMKSSTVKFSKGKRAFSLIEILVVVTIMILVIAISGSLFKGSGQEMTRAANSMSDILQQARTRAMSNNNYVYVGLSSTDSSSPELVVAMLEAIDGLGSNSNNLVNDPTNPSIQPSRAVSILKGVRLDTTTANTNLPGNPLTALTGNIEILDETRTDPITFSASMATRRTDVTDDQFDWVIQFSPDGAARLDATSRTVPDYIVMGLIPATGNQANAVGIVIDGPSGAVRFLRPGV